MTEEVDRLEFPSDKELDDIKQLLGARTIHIQMGCHPDAPAADNTEFISRVTERMKQLFGASAVRLASADAISTIGTAFHSMYDTALMRMWWEKYGAAYKKGSHK